MRRFLFLTIAVAVSLSASAAQPTLAEAMAKLEAVADGFPARVAEADRKSVQELWYWVEKGLLDYQAAHAPADEASEYLLGELYRLGHNLGKIGAAEKAVEHLRTAIKLDPSDPRPHLSLGRLLTFNNQPADGQTELLLGAALEPHGPSDHTIYDLAFCFYLQRQFALAANLAERYVASHPDEAGLKTVAEVSRRVLAGGEAPKTLTIEKQ